MILKSGLVRAWCLSRVFTHPEPAIRQSSHEALCSINFPVIFCPLDLGDDCPDNCRHYIWFSCGHATRAPLWQLFQHSSQDEHFYSTGESTFRHASPRLLEIGSVLYPDLVHLDSWSTHMHDVEKAFYWNVIASREVCARLSSSAFCPRLFISNFPMILCLYRIPDTYYWRFGSFDERRIL